MLQCNRGRQKNTERDRGQRRKIRIAARDNGTLRHQFFRVIDHLPGEILDREFLTSVVRVLITEQLHRIVPPSRSDDLVALARLIRYDHGVTPSDRRCGPPRRSVTMIALPKTNTISAIVPR
jgi:hypothetical protein